MTDCYLNGKKVTFTSQEFIASGGQGEVYGKNGIAYKIYHDPSGMIPVEKIKELQTTKI